MSRQSDQCDLCGGELLTSETSLDVWRGKNLIVFSDLPADVCQQCGEAYFSAEISEKLDHFLTEHQQHRPNRYIPVPEYSASQAFG